MSTDYRITKIYVVSQHSIVIFDSKDITPFEVQKKHELNTNIFVTVQTNQLTFGLNYSRLITDSALCSINSWDIFSNSLTDSVVLGYKETIPGYGAGDGFPTSQLLNWDVMNCTNTFDVNYADYKTGNAGIFPYRWNLKDLKISLQENVKQFPNLTQCVPIVNGLICRPVYRETENSVYALGGAHLCWQTLQTRTPEIQLLDFSELGDTKTVSIKLAEQEDSYPAFTISFRNRQSEFDISCDWNITSPYSLYEYSPILVIGGIPLFPDQYRIVDEFTLSFNLSTLPLHFALVYRKYLQAEASTTAGVSYETEDMISYLKKQFDLKQTEYSRECFVILVKTPKLYIGRIPLDVWRNGITMNLYAQEGLLLHKATGTIRVYYNETLSDRKELSVQNLDKIYVVDNSVLQKQMAFVPPDCSHQQLKNIQESTCEMLHVMR